MDKLNHDRLKVMRYIDEHPVVVLSTIDDYNRPHGSIVYAVSGNHQTKMHVYFLTKTETAHFHNLTHRPAVSIASYDAEDVSTLQAQGHATLEQDPRAIDMVMKQLARAHAEAESWLPPIATLRDGTYVLVGMTVSHARLGRFLGPDTHHDKIFTEIK